MKELVLCLAALCLFACSGKTQLPDTYEGLFPETLQTEPFDDEAANAFPVEAGPEIHNLKPGDILKIDLLEDDLVSGEYLVQPDGTVTIPLVGTLIAEGKSRAAISDEIAEVLHDYYTELQLSVSVASWDARHAFVLGAVVAPGSVDLKPDDNLLTVLARAGGPRERRNERQQTLGFPQAARIIRDENVAFINLKRVLNGEDFRGNVAIMPGDVIFVPIEATPTVIVLGEVSSPGMVGLSPGMDIMQAIGYAGGMNLDAENTKIRVIRGWWTEEPQTYNLNFRDLRAGDEQITPLKLQDQDVVYVDRRGLARVRYFIQSVTPSFTVLGAAGMSPAGG